MKTYEGERSRFLAELLRGTNVTKACELAGVPRRTMYDLRDRIPAFADEWDNAIKESKDVLLAKYEGELFERALDRNDPRSYLLLMFLVKKLDPTYRDNYKTESKIIHETVREFDFSSEDIDTAIDILRKAKEKS